MVIGYHFANEVGPRCEMNPETCNLYQEAEIFYIAPSGSRGMRGGCLIGYALALTQTGGGEEGVKIEEFCLKCASKQADYGRIGNTLC